MTPTSHCKTIDDSQTVFALIVTGTLGVAAFLILPSIVIGMVADLSLNERQVGTVSTAQLIGLAAGSFLNLWLVRRLHWRQIALLGIVALLIADFGSIFANSYKSFLVARFLAGIAGGIAVSFAAYAIGNTSASDRNYGWFLTFQVFFAIVGLLTLPRIVEAADLDALFATFIVIEGLVLILLCPRIPQIKITAQGGTGTNDLGAWVLCTILLLAIVCFYVALGGFWTYIAPIGLDRGLSEHATGTALSVGLVGGLVGAYVAATVNVRLGRTLPVLIALSSQLLAVFLLMNDFEFLTLVIAACAFCFGWYMLFPYQLGLLAALDRDGRPLILSNAVAGVGSGLGPFVVAQFLSDGFTAAYVICLLFLSLTLLLTLGVIALSARRLSSASA